MPGQTLQQETLIDIVNDPTECSYRCETFKRPDPKISVGMFFLFPTCSCLYGDQIPLDYPLEPGTVSEGTFTLFSFDPNVQPISTASPTKSPTIITPFPTKAPTFSPTEPIFRLFSFGEPVSAQGTYLFNSVVYEDSINFFSPDNCANQCLIYDSSITYIPACFMLDNSEYLGDDDFESAPFCYCFWAPNLPLPAQNLLPQEKLIGYFPNKAGNPASQPFIVADKVTFIFSQFQPPFKFINIGPGQCLNEQNQLYSFAGFDFIVSDEDCATLCYTANIDNKVTGFERKDFTCYCLFSNPIPDSNTFEGLDYYNNSLPATGPIIRSDLQQEYKCFIIEDVEFPDNKQFKNVFLGNGTCVDKDNQEYSRAWFAINEAEQCSDFLLSNFLKYGELVGFQFNNDLSNCVALYSDPLPDIDWINFGATGSFSDYDGNGKIEGVNDQNLDYQCYRFEKIQENNNNRLNFLWFLLLPIFAIPIYYCFKNDSKNDSNDIKYQFLQ